MPDSTPRSDRRARALADLAAEVEREARRAPFDLCLETYAAAERDPHVPIFCAGDLRSRFVAVGRELGREEVHAGEPLIGMSGRRFRRAAHESLIGPAPKSERQFDAVLEHVLLTNMVPYRPVGNRAYDRVTCDRFRPFIERLLAEIWTGDRVLALGQHAILWFEPYAAPGAIKDLWRDRENRFDHSLPIVIGGRELTLCPLPHPSPLSPFKARFADDLARWLRD